MPFNVTVPATATAADPDVVQVYQSTAGSGGVSSFDTGTIDVAGYSALQIDVALRTDNNGAGASAVKCWFNGDSSASNYYCILAQRGLNNSNGSLSQALVRSSAVEIFETADADSGSGLFSVGRAVIMSPGSASVYKHSHSQTMNLRKLLSTDYRYLNHYARVWKSTSAITRIQLVPDEGGNFVEHSTFAVYGIK